MPTGGLHGYVARPNREELRARARAWGAKINRGGRVKKGKRRR